MLARIFADKIPPMAPNPEKTIAEQLLRIDAVKLRPREPFTWASGILSPIYCDNRRVLSFPEVRTLVKNAFVERSSVFGSFDVVAGVATAGIPHGALLADALGKPFVYIRSEAKKHGMKNLVEGDLRPGSRLLVIEDLISTGGSSLKAVEAAREAGATVVGVLAIFTYCFSEAERAFADAGCPLATLSNYRALLQIAVEKAFVPADTLSELERWRENPREWSPS
jgi:orotate phosphoribosyltransferase